MRSIHAAQAAQRPLFCIVWNSLPYLLRLGTSKTHHELMFPGVGVLVRLAIRRECRNALQRMPVLEAAMEPELV